MNGTAIPKLLTSQDIHFLTTSTPFYYTPEASVISWFPDRYLSLAAPVIAYWAFSLFFLFLDNSGWKWLDRYRIHESAEVKSKNLVTINEVIRAVIVQHVIQTALGLAALENEVSGAGVDHLGNMLSWAPTLARIATAVLGQKAGLHLLEANGAQLLYALYWWAIPLTKLFIAMNIIDTWQYFMHRAMHMNTYLYKKFHSVHHRLYVPYAFGALYNHPLEGFLLDTVGTFVAQLLTHLTIREATVLFTVSTFKTVDDHCGYRFPFDPLQLASSNNADYHDIHHQVIGIKSNFSQPFFIHWDVLLGTRMTRKDIELRRAKGRRAD